MEIQLGSKFWLGVAWTCFAFILFAAARMLLETLWIGGLTTLLAAVIAAPPLRSKLQEMFKIKIPSVVIVVMSAGLLLQGIFLAGEAQQRQSDEVERTTEQAMKARIAEKLAVAESDFVSRKFEILADAQSKFESGDVGAAKSALIRYSRLQDPDLVRLRKVVFGAALRKELETDIAEDRRAAVFAELAALDPSDKESAAMASEMNSKIQSRRARAASAQATLEAVKSQFSRLDGSHPAVERAIKGRMKNPGSYKHVETRLGDASDETYTVITRYRGTNSFNATVTTTAVATLNTNGQVIWLENQ